MRWKTAISQQADTSAAFLHACDSLRLQSRDEVDVLLVFFSEHHAASARELGLAMVQAFPRAVCLGCNAAGVVGSSNLGPSGASLSVTAGMLPGVQVRPVRFEADVHDQPSFDWRGELGMPEAPHFLILSQATGFETSGLLHALDRAFPQTCKFGGLIEAGTAVGCRLILEGHVYHHGAIGLALAGNVSVDTLVAQGCRPIGEPVIVVSHSQNVVHGFDRGNPMQVFRQMVGGLSEAERELAHHAMFVGIGVGDSAGVYNQGDFLIRNIIGFNPKTGDLAVAAPIGDHEVLQFHLMDSTTSGAAFESVVSTFASGPGQQAEQPALALLFSGFAGDQSRSDKALLESDILRAHLNATPIAGFFSEGEIAPIGLKSRVHGYASSVAILRASEGAG